MKDDKSVNSISAFELQDVLLKLIGLPDTPNNLPLKVLYDYMKLNDVVVEFRFAVDLKEE